jgi:hypothetical protein
MLYNSNYMTFQKRQNCGDNEKLSSCQGLVRWEGVMNGQNTEDF